MLDLPDLYSRYAADVRRFALYLTGDGALADDITSETFLRAWNSVGRIREATVTLMPLSFVFIGDRVHLMMLRDNPGQSLFLWVVALSCWWLYYAMGRRLRTPAP